mmetsp:Transcript_73052/g.169365  ORF Transcript_73052/g.169365 Transcript_73052/m.169365 type:complete len:224 (+) Transcript_73052:501-1172(+)
MGEMKKSSNTKSCSFAEGGTSKDATKSPMHTTRSLGHQSLRSGVRPSNSKVEPKWLDISCSKRFAWALWCGCRQLEDRTTVRCSPAARMSWARRPARMLETSAGALDTNDAKVQAPFSPPPTVRRLTATSFCNAAAFCPLPLTGGGRSARSTFLSLSNSGALPWPSEIPTLSTPSTSTKIKVCVTPSVPATAPRLESAGSFASAMTDRNTRSETTRPSQAVQG